jgi:hypothetical protein
VFQDDKKIVKFVDEKSSSLFFFAGGGLETRLQGFAPYPLDLRFFAGCAQCLAKGAAFA